MKSDRKSENSKSEVKPENFSKIMAEKLIHLFEKLNNQNYIHWSFKIKVILVQNECWNVIEDEKPTVEAEIKNWEKADAKARYFLTLCVENN